MTIKRWIVQTILAVAGLVALLLADHGYRAQLHQEDARALAQASAEMRNRMPEDMT
jgi:hypothetical protein